ncbi:MAG: acyltransferase family protein [Trueperaceae bacterium]
MLPTIPPAQPRRTIHSIQALRAIAALLVVAAHVEAAFRDSPEVAGIPWISQFAGLSGFGGVGVDIFFIISGFIMVYVGVPYFRKENTIQDFLMRRILRIYPIYWLVSLFLVGLATLKTILAIRAGQSFAESLDFDLQWHRLLSAISLFPTYNELGDIQPILGVGWTLSFEVFFYLVFTLALSIGFRWTLSVVIATFSLLVFIPWPIGNSALGNFFTDGILLEFPMGMLLGYAVVLGKRPARWLLMSCFVLSLVGYVIGILLQADFSHRYLFRGIPSTLLVFSLVFWEICFGLRVPAFLVKLGDASYATYLVHTIVISYLVFPIIETITLLQQINVEILGIFTFLIATFIGLMVYEVFERPLQGWLMKWYKSGQTARAQARESINP